MAFVDYISRAWCVVVGHRVGYRLGDLRQCGRCGHVWEV